MPFDALILRQLAVGWQDTVVGIKWTHAEIEPGRVRLGGSGTGFDLAIVLTPGLARIHRVPGRAQKPRGKAQHRSPFLESLLPATVRAITVVAWERIVYFELEQEGDLGEIRRRRLIVELAGHLTNLILVDHNQIVVDALKRVAPSSAGRTVFPGYPYTPPPALKDPCQTQNPKDLPPLARQKLTQVGPEFWNTLCHDYSRGTFSAYRLENPKQTEVWVYPLDGYQSVPVRDLDQAVDAVFSEKERRLRESSQKTQYAARLKDQVHHLQQRLAEWNTWLADDGESDRELGDLWLAHQYDFAAQDAPSALTVDSFRCPGTPIVLRLEDGLFPHEMAEQAYRRYKKAKSRQEVAMRLVDQTASALTLVEADLEAVESGQLTAEDIAARLRNLASHPTRPSGDRADKPTYRRFTSQHGYPIWVGRSREENQSLTFRQARPDDLWFHAKQVPGSHVILFCGKANPPLDDLLDAAELAVFYSPAQHSSMVPVDYTRRKLVKKRPHAEPGQVLYRQEKTLYITPDGDRLKRLGAVKERLGEL